MTRAPRRKVHATRTTAPAYAEAAAQVDRKTTGDEAHRVEHYSMLSDNVTRLRVTPTSGLGSELFPRLITGGYRPVCQAHSEHPQWQADCPLCDRGRHERKLGVAYKRHRDGAGFVTIIGCYCGAGFDDIAEILGFDHRVKDDNEGLQKYVGPNGESWLGESGQPAEPMALPEVEEIGTWHENLLEEPEYATALQYLTDQRGLSLDIIRRAQVGYRPAAYGFPRKREAFTVPVWNPRRDALLNLYQRVWPGDPYANGKTTRHLCLKGHGRHLYPRLLDPRPSAILCEGLFDALACRDRDLPAITSTHGTTWDDTWYQRFARKKIVYVCFDGDKFEEGQRRAAAFVEHGIPAVAIDLRETGLEPAEDLTDWFVKYGRSADDLTAFLRKCRQEWR